MEYCFPLRRFLARMACLQADSFELSVQSLNIREIRDLRAALPFRKLLLAEHGFDRLPGETKSKPRTAAKSSDVGVSAREGKT